MWYNSNEVEVSDAWNQIDEKSSGYQKIHVEKDLLSMEDIVSIKSALVRVLRKIEKLQAYSDGFRLWVSEERKDFNYIRKLMSKSCSNLDAGLEGWAERGFGDDPFCLILNYAERFDNYFASFFSNILKPVIDKYGLPVNGLHTTTFIGNYGYTPIGIHMDTANAYVFSFHLGPNYKVMHTWDTKVYESMDPKVNETQVNRFLPFSKKHVLGPGDMYFMPWGVYHLGETQQLSISVTVWFDNHPSKKVTLSLMDDYLENVLADNHVVPEDQVKEHNIKDKFNQMLKSLQLNDHKSSIEDLLWCAFEQRVKKNFSNGGWSRKPVSLSNEKEKSEIFLSKKTRIQLIRPFYLTYTVSGSTMVLYARSFEINMIYSEQLLDLIHRLNTYEVLSGADIQEILIDLPGKVVNYFLSVLNNARTIELIQ
ncbi:MAG: cupin domain-containing protein [Cytophagales bacterium]|nr:cupin domain-containing protein [Cytophagales bacterium]